MMGGFARTKTAPTPYPRILFHLIRCSQAVAALVVSGIMFYFIWNLIHEDFEAPKTFWTLLAASLLTLLCLIGTLTIYVLFRLSPLWNLCINAVLLMLWAPAFAFLWFWSKPTLSHVCNKKTWEDSTGIMVCRIYKSLFAFAMFGVVSTLAALLLDIMVFRRTVSRGKYKQMVDEKPVGIAAPYNAPEYSDSRGSIQLQQYTTPTSHNPDRAGYEVPEEQFNYDTSYHGGHEPDAAPPGSKQ